jgi:TolA-binding protein
MSNAVKLALFVLLLLLGISAFMALSALSQKSFLEKSKADLQKKLDETTERESKLLAERKKIDEELKTAKDSEAKIRSQFNTVNEQISALTKERDDWKNRVDAIRKERDDLMAKLQAQPSIISAVTPPTVTAPLTTTPSVPTPSGEVSDMYLAEILKDKSSLDVCI